MKVILLYCCRNPFGILAVDLELTSFSKLANKATVRLNDTALVIYFRYSMARVEKLTVL